MSNDHYTLKQSSQLRNSLRLLNVASSKDSGDWNCVLHTHTYAELFFVVGGSGHIQIDHELHPITPHQLIIINPNVMHTERSDSDNPLEYVVLGIEGLELSLKLNLDNRFRILDSFDAEQIHSCIRSILEESQSKLPGSETICQAFLDILLTRLMRSTDFALNKDPLPSSNNQCAAVRRYIDTHFKEPLTLDMLAEIARVNKFYLAHSFKEEYGVSPITYQLNRRIDEGCYLLKQTDMSLTQIARVLGFSSPSYFSQIFRKYKNLTPSEYRKMIV